MLWKLRVLSGIAVFLVVAATVHTTAHAQTVQKRRVGDGHGMYGAKASRSYDSRPQYSAYHRRYRQAPDPYYSNAMQDWYRRQAADDRAHEAFIDYIRGTDSRERQYRHSYVEASYGGYYGRSHRPSRAYAYDDSMRNWYRTQRSNDRAHQAFIDYIRN